MPLPSEFTAAVARLRVAAGEDAQAVRTPGAGRRAWALYRNLGLALTEHLQQPTVLRRLVNNRAGGNAMYVDALRAGPGVDPVTGRPLPQGSIGSLSAAKGAVDYLAVVERAAQAAAAGRVRVRVWAASRRAGMAADYGPYDAVRRHLDAMLAAGQPPTPTGSPG